MAQNFMTLLQPIVVTVSGAGTQGPWYLKTEQLDHWDVIADWTGTIAGAWKIESGAGVRDVNNLGVFPGKWSDVTARAIPAPVNPAGSAGTTELSAVFWTAPWMRLSLIVSGGSGALTLYPSGKKS